jgi:hypothetical protein
VCVLSGRARMAEGHRGRPPFHHPAGGKPSHSDRGAAGLKTGAPIFEVVLSLCVPHTSFDSLKSCLGSVRSFCATQLLSASR